MTIIIIAISQATILSHYSRLVEEIERKMVLLAVFLHLVRSFYSISKSVD
jgi:hypothetical protein